jgi:hypothetical protein
MTSTSTPSATRFSATVLWALVAVDLVVLAWFITVTQLRLEVTTSTPTPIGLTASRARTPAIVEVPASVRVVVTNDGDGTLFVNPFVTGKNATLSDAATYQATGDFTVEGNLRDGGRWRSTKRGSTVAWEGQLSGLEVWLTGGTVATTACIDSTTLPRQCVELSPAAVHHLHVPSGRWLHHALIPVWREAVTLEAVPADVQSVRVLYGLDVIAEVRGPLVDRRLELTLDLGKRVWAVAGVGGSALLLLAQALAMVAFLLLVGAAVVTPFVDRLSLLEAMLLCFFVGEGLTTNLVSSVFHVAPLRVAWTAMVIPVAGLLLAQLWWRGGWARWRRLVKSVSRPDARTLGTLSLLAVTSTLVCFYPAVLFPGWYHGHVYTDTIDYPAWASVALDGPLDWGLGGIRYQDYLRLGITAMSTGLDATTAMTTEAVRLWLVLPFLAFALFQRLHLPERAALAGAAVAAHGAVLFQLYSQGYVPQYETAHFVLAGAWATLWFIDGRVDAAKTASPWWADVALGCVFAASVGLYPYQAFSVMAFGVVWLGLVLIRRDWSDALSLARVVAVVVIVVNVNLDVVFDFGRGSMQHRPVLNLLAHNVIFPWHEGPRAPVILAGLDDLVRHSDVADGFHHELFDAMPKTARRFSAALGLMARLGQPFAWLFWILAAASAVFALRRRDRGGLVVALTLAIGAALTSLLAVRGDLYFWIKSLLSLSSLAFVLVGGLLASVATTAATRAVRIGAGLLLTALVALSLRVVWFDHVGQLVSRKSETLVFARTHLSNHDEPLWRFADWSQRLPPGQTFAFAGRIDDRYWTDGDMVVYNKLLTVLEGHTVVWGPGHSQRYSRLRQMETPVGTRADWYLAFAPCPAGIEGVPGLDAWCVSPKDPRVAPAR